jgi:hypothetical protein
MGIAGIVQLLTILEPQIVNLVMFIKDKSTGQLSAIAILDSVDAQVKANQDALTNYIASKQGS